MEDEVDGEEGSLLDIDVFSEPLEVVGKEGSAPVVPGKESSPPDALGNEERVPDDEGEEESPPDVSGGPVDELKEETGPVTDEDTVILLDGSLGSPPVGVLEG